MPAPDPTLPGWALLTLATATALLAAVPFGQLAAAVIADVDLRAAGSGNIGATNAARVGGPRLGALTLGLDVGKGLLPVLLAGALAPDAAGALGLVAVAAHCYSPYLGLRGGKGVATGAGALLGLAPVPTLGLLALWALVVSLTRRSSLGALAAAVAAPPLLAATAPAAAPWAAGIAALILVRHAPNLRRLRAGAEPAFGAQSGDSPINS
jgi:glycerol-3-phosphate acyltransferase PlsY